MSDTWAAKVLEGVPRHYDANCDRVIMEADALAAIAKLAERDALRAKVARLEGALTLAANRLQRRAVDYLPGSRLFIETSEWADEARAALTDGGKDE